MAEKPAKNQTEASKQALDLNSLSGLDFGPNWADENAKPARLKNYDSHGKGGKGGRRGGGAPRDRRSSSSGSGGRDGQSDRRGPSSPNATRGRRDDRSDLDTRHRGRGRGRPAAPAHFEPTVKVDLYPQDEAFEALINRLRSSARTYQLFDIAHLLLEKPDRYIVVVSPKPVKGGETKQLYFSVPGHLPFETEEDAINYVITNHLDLFFDIEEIEIDPPKGNFQMVNRCSITGELLGPPNYHRYQEFLQRHYAARITGMSFERFTSKVEGVKDQEQIDAWLESMKKGARYTVKERQEGETESFESLEAARHFLLQHRKDQVVGSGATIRFAGRDIERLPAGDIRRSVEAYVENQKHFPLDSANNIRGRLRRHKFAVYKKGSKGVSYVCAVKRKFRDSQTSFTDSIRDLIEFIEKHPDMPASKLPKEYIGIDTEKQKPEALKMTEAEVEAAAKAKAEAAAKAKAEAAAESPTADADESERASDVVIENQDQQVAPALAEDAKASTEATPKAELSQEEQKKLGQLMLDLRWLITEGYVTEYGDGRLFAAPPMPEAKPKESKLRAPKAPTVASVVPAEASQVVEPVAEATEATADVPVLPVSDDKSDDTKD
ncbi:hypothetical protein QEH59_16700 [Coraliomargarita sp. SDUM461004]|uniref:Uncharacterized protein n=1 Tax=Thalassobacterium sedimentorum TaxID=3041258 RepID=A0ABU1AMN9_9BACT|nr:hypothetical protein [Coraliomargarita sp. SDUM461004]MDQ8196077.1 hypothetical protein [Coraliomargarita sp. SDUM461004]